MLSGLFQYVVDTGCQVPPHQCFHPVGVAGECGRDLAVFFDPAQADLGPIEAGRD